MKVSELSGAALDWAVAEAGGVPIYRSGKTLSRMDVDEGVYWQPSIDWWQGGPIIEREKLLLTYAPDGGDDPDQPWVCDDYAGEVCSGMYWGSTPLIAAMRCYVASKLGDDIEIPKELV